MADKINYNFDEIITRRGTSSLKWDSGAQLKMWGMTDRFDDDTISLFTADMDLATPPEITAALRKVCDNRIFGYTVASDEYHDAIKKWFKTRHDVTIKSEEIIYCAGTVNAVNVAVRAYTKKGDKVILQTPIYPPFIDAINRCDRVVINNPLIEKDGYYTIDFEDFEQKAAQENTTLFILCSPHNPTGRVFSPEDLRRMAEICKRHGVYIAADEIHGDLVRCEQTFYPIAACAEDMSGIVTFTAVNKTFNVAGLHATNVIIKNKENRDLFYKHNIGTLQLISPFTMAAVISAYTECDEWLDQLKEYIDGNIDFVMSFLAENMPQVKVLKPEGTYILWMDFRGYGLPDSEIHRRIYNVANVVLEDGHMFGEEGVGYQRVCLSSPRPMLKEAFERIENAFSDLK